MLSKQIYNRLLQCPREPSPRRETPKKNQTIIVITASIPKSEEDKNHSLLDHAQEMIINQSNRVCLKNPIVLVPSYSAAIQSSKNHRK